MQGIFGGTKNPGGFFSMVAVKGKLLKEPKGKKCDYCDDFASYKVPDEGLYIYLCQNCYENPERARDNINE